MPIVADEYAHVIGVDTHARTHTYVVLDTRTGGVVDTATFPTSAAGIARVVVDQPSNLGSVPCSGGR